MILNTVKYNTVIIGVVGTVSFTFQIKLFLIWKIYGNTFNNT